MISHDFNVPLRTHPLQDHGVYKTKSSSLERAQDFAERHGVLEVAYEELANDPKVGEYVAVQKNKVFLMAVGGPRVIVGTLSTGAVREATLVRTYFGSPPDQHSTLSGCALLDIAVYCLQFVLMMLNGERLESIQAAGMLLDWGMSRQLGIKTIYIYKVCGPILQLNFTNSIRFRKSPRMPLADSILLTEITDEIWDQVGVVFSQESQ
uniref:Uncharacterized protein n=1 Tax=Hippocampus comes TaxID=109280 RepID=A0A3Q2YI62_HIPCM